MFFCIFFGCFDSVLDVVLNPFWFSFDVFGFFWIFFGFSQQHSTSTLSLLSSSSDMRAAPLYGMAFVT